MEGITNNYITAKDISLKFKIPYSTVNHYTNLGFFSVVKRQGNVRFYSTNEVKARLEKIARWKDEEYPLRLMVKMLRKGA